MKKTRLNNTDDTIRKLITNSFDLHVHIGPEIIPRKFNYIEDLALKEKGKLKGMALKNHFYSTQPLISATRNTYNLLFIGSVVLNNFQGGLNPEAIYANALLSELPTIVWLPTISAEQFLLESTYEIAPEWVQAKNFKARLAKDIQPVIINEKIDDVLKAIKKNQAILATGHIKWQETVAVIEKAASLGIKRMIVTHPIYQKINFPNQELVKLTKLGAMMEQCYSMYSIDKIPISKIAEQIKIVGAQYCILSSDVGQTFSPPPSEALFIFANSLLNQGISLSELEIMLVKNPNDLVALNKLA